MVDRAAQLNTVYEAMLHGGLSYEEARDLTEDVVQRIETSSKGELVEFLAHWNGGIRKLARNRMGSF